MRLFKFNHNEPALFYKEATEYFGNAAYINGHLHSESESGIVNIHHYNQFPGLEVSVVSGIQDEDTLIEDIDEGLNVVVIRFMLKSFLYLKSENEAETHSDLISGCCMYNSKFPFDLIIPKNREVEFITFRLKLDLLDEFKIVSWLPIEETFFIPKPYAIYETLDSNMENCVKNIFSLQNTTEGRIGFTYSEGMKLLTFFFLKLLGKRKDTSESSKLTVAPETLVQMKNVLCSDFEHPISVSKLAEKFGMSPQKLRVNFKKFFGKSANQLLQQIRYEEAERKLLHTNDTIQSIAIALGFNSAAHFTGEFKKRHEISPTEFRYSKR